MSLFENPNYYGEETEDQDPLFPQVDPVQRAAEAQRERLRKDAEAKAEKEAKVAQKKAEKEAKVAKKLASKTVDQVKEKIEKTESSTELAKEKVAEVKEAVGQMTEQIAEVAEDGIDPVGNAPVEMRFTEGSEYISELREGEEAIFELSNKANDVEQTIQLADEVTERAQALARARAALDEVVSGDMGVERNNLEATQEVFGVTGPEQDVRDRLRSTWEPEASVSSTGVMDNNVPSRTADATADLLLPSPLDDQERTIVSPWFVSGATNGGSTSEVTYAGSSTGSTEYARDEPSVEKKPSHTGGAAASVAGFLAGKSRSLREDLRRVDTDLRTDVGQLQASLPSIEQSLPAISQAGANQEAALPQFVPDRKSTKELAKAPSMSAGHQDAIPAWIRQVEAEVKKGRVVELKKWQRDVLKSQHPELLKRYDRVDQKEKARIKSQSFEHGTAPSRTHTPVLVSQPGDLPAPSSLFVSKQPQPQYAPSVPMAYPQVTVLDTVRGEVTSGSYITIVSIGGILMGTVLIALFGL